METIRLVSGHEIPVLGLGTWNLRDEQCKTVVKIALELGYNHIDTAWMYANQKEIGDAHCEKLEQLGRIFILPLRFGTRT